MRDIKFRAFKENTKEFIYGVPTHQFDLDYVSQGMDDVPPRYWYMVLPKFGVAEIDGKTIGQYTGLKDKNGVQIYEGDVCETTDNSYILIESKEIKSTYSTLGIGFTFYGYNNDLEVVGNIHENPELIK